MIISLSHDEVAYLRRVIGYFGESGVDVETRDRLTARLDPRVDSPVRGRAVELLVSMRADEIADMNDRERRELAEDGLEGVRGLTDEELREELEVGLSEQRGLTLAEVVAELEKQGG